MIWYRTVAVFFQIPVQRIMSRHTNVEICRACSKRFQDYLALVPQAFTRFPYAAARWSGHVPAGAKAGSVSAATRRKRTKSSMAFQPENRVALSQDVAQSLSPLVAFPSQGSLIEYCFWVRVLQCLCLGSETCWKLSSLFFATLFVSFCNIHASASPILNTLDLQSPGRSSLAVMLNTGPHAKTCS